MASANSSSRLLTTKLFAPVVRSDCVVRPRVDARLEAGTCGPVTLVCSAAGFGKTTAVADWLRRTQRLSAWLSLDEHDSDPRRFLAYLVAALQRAIPGVGESLRVELDAGGDASVRLGFIELINDLVIAEIVLVLDDLHLVRGTAVPELLTFFVDALPASVHVVLTSRVDPTLPLGRWRARGMLTEIRAPELRFTLDEASAFLGNSMGLVLSSEALEKLDLRTEGWIAGLQLAAISLRDRRDTDAFIDGFAGSHRFVLDYLMEEVLSRMQPERRALLLEMSILQELSGALVEAVTQRPQSRLELQALEAENLFIVPLDDRRHAYRFHHLFATLLQHELTATMPEAYIRGLHSRASRAFEAERDDERAIEHAIAAKEWDRAEQMIVSSAARRMLREVNRTLVEAYRRFPREEFERRPALLVKHAWVLSDGRQTVELEATLVTLRDRLAAYPDPMVSAELALLDATEALERGDLPVARARFIAAEQGLTPANGLLWGQYLFHRSYLAMREDAFDEAERWAERLEADVRPLGDTFANMWARWARAQVALVKGDPITTLRMIRGMLPELRETFGDHPPRTTAVGFVTMAHAHYERGELDDAAEWIERALELMDPSDDPGQGCILILVQARIELARDPCGSGWKEAIRHGESLVERLDMPLFASWLSALRLFAVLDPRTPADPRPFVEAWLAQAGIREQQHLVFRGPIFPTSRNEFALLILARCLALQGEHATARPMIQGYIARAHHAGRRLCEVEGWLALAELERRCGREADVDLAVDQAVTRAADQKLAGCFRHYDETFAARGAQIAAQRGDRALADVLLPTAPPPSPPAPANAAPMGEALSSRESEVLLLVAEGLSNAEIGRRLFVAPSTVKKHLEHVYDKLGVRRRTQAVARARSYGWLPS